MVSGFSENQHVLSAAERLKSSQLQFGFRSRVLLQPGTDAQRTRFLERSRTLCPCFGPTSNKKEPQTPQNAAWTRRARFKLPFLTGGMGVNGVSPERRGWFGSPDDEFCEDEEDEEDGGGAAFLLSVLQVCSTLGHPNTTSVPLLTSGKTS